MLKKSRIVYLIGYRGQQRVEVLFESPSGVVLEEKIERWTYCGSRLEIGEIINPAIYPENQSELVLGCFDLSNNTHVQKYTEEIQQHMRNPNRYSDY